MIINDCPFQSVTDRDNHESFQQVTTLQNFWIFPSKFFSERVVLKGSEKFPKDTVESNFPKVTCFQAVNLQKLYFITNAFWNFSKIFKAVLQIVYERQALFSSRWAPEKPFAVEHNRSFVKLRIEINKIIWYFYGVKKLMVKVMGIRKDSKHNF